MLMATGKKGRATIRTFKTWPKAWEPAFAGYSAGMARAIWSEGLITSFAGVSGPTEGIITDDVSGSSGANRLASDFGFAVYPA